MNEQSQPSISSSLPLPAISSVTNLVHTNDGSKKPLINVLPSSKLLSRNLLHHKSLRKRRVSSRLTQSTRINQVRSNNRDLNFSSDAKGKLHTQISNNNAHPMSNQSVPPQFTQRPPINLFKLRMPFSPHAQQRMHHQQHQQPPKDDSNLNLLPPPNPMLPPPVVLVPYPIPLPVIVPIPLPLSAFLRAYQTKGYSEISSNDNDSHEDTLAKGARINENEQPLDLSSEQGGFSETDKNFISPGTLNSNNNNRGEITLDGEAIKSGSSSNINISEYEETAMRKEMQHHAVVKDDVSCENNRKPLRKRKIIAEELGESQ